VTIADALISSVKVSAALTWEPKQIEMWLSLLADTAEVSIR